MMAVIVGTALQLGEDGIGSPSAIFLIALSGSFFIAACLHPQEFWCVVPGIIYLMSIPSMYLLLILYSIINLNVVSWGTREVVAKKTKKVGGLACMSCLVLACTACFVVDLATYPTCCIVSFNDLICFQEKTYFDVSNQSTCMALTSTLPPSSTCYRHWNVYDLTKNSKA